MLDNEPDNTAENTSRDHRREHEQNPADADRGPRRAGAGPRPGRPVRPHPPPSPPRTSGDSESESA